MTIVKHSEELINYFLSLNLKLTKPQQHHMLNFLSGLINFEGKKNLSNLNRNLLNTTNRSNFNRFLTLSPWDEEDLNQKRLKNSYSKLLENSTEDNSPLFLSIDDTLISKSKNCKHIEGISKLHSHVTGKYEMAHCQVSLQGKSMDLSIPLDFKIYQTIEYCEEHEIQFKSKNELAFDLIKDLKLPETNRTYLLMDSWYSSSELIMNALGKGIHSIVPLKKNRNIYPEGIGIQLEKYENLIDESCLNLVTVKGKDYYIYRYEGNLKGIENAVVLFSYQVEGDTLSKPMYILSTDISLSNGEIIRYYLNRWDIEVSFRYQKNSLGLTEYQMRSLKGIKRLWYIIYLAHNYLVLMKEKDKEKNIGKVIEEERITNKKHTILKILDLKESGMCKEEILDIFIKKVA